MDYDASEAPHAEDWLETPEVERLTAVLAYHERERVRVGNLRVHAAIHVTVENQLAGGYAVTVRALERLLGEGLDRHDALHAIGSVVVEQMQAALQAKSFDEVAFQARLNALSASASLSSWENE